MTAPLTSEEAAGLGTVAKTPISHLAGTIPTPATIPLLKMIESTQPSELPLLARILRTYYRTKLRGRTRVTMLIARHAKSLQAVPIRIADHPDIYVDLRQLSSHFWLIGTPFEHSPLEMDEQSVMRRFVHVGDTVFDIGANIGMHTTLLSQLVGPRGRVFAFEPNAELLQTLTLTVARLRNAVLYPYALSDRATEAPFFVPVHHTMSSLADWTTNATLDHVRFGKARTITVQQQRIDDLVADGILPLPNFIKCDVEGAELKVFRGGENTLDHADAPVILFEAGPESAAGFGLSMTDAARFLGALPRPGYQFFELLGGGTLRRVEPSDLKPHNQNVLAVPREECAKNRLSSLD
jgi:FkbM family methyltransferase